VRALIGGGPEKARTKSAACHAPVLTRSGLGPGPPGRPGAGPVLQSAALVRTGLVVARTVKAAEENRSAEPAEESLSGTTVSY